MKRSLLIVSVLCVSLLTSPAQEQKGVTLSGSIQSDMLIPQDDEAIGAEKTEDFLTNTYADLQLQSRYVDAGARLEYLEHPLPGFENDFKGWGVPNFWVKGKLGNNEVTLGTFYEQFGSGFILRTYEERSLGIDNSLLGGRLMLKPTDGVILKVLSGKQRRYWDWNKALINGADAEVSIDRWIPAIRQRTVLTLGASWVNKYEKNEEKVFVDNTHYIHFPKFVNAWDVCANLNHGAWNILAEYAQKTADPSFDNGYVFKNGSVAMLSGSYSDKGLSILLQAKRSENRMNVKVNYSYVRSIPHEFSDGIDRYTLTGITFVDYKSPFFKWGDETYYQDLNIQISRRMTRDFRLNLMYMNQRYNKTVIEGEGGMIHSNIFIADGKYQFSNRTTLRCELQYLTTKQDEGDWAYGLMELSLVPHWMITVSDMWNCGETDTHYYQGLVTYNVRSHRIQAGYGRTRAGYNCSGGVCRYVPAQKGFTVSYNYNF